jgi:hypothetical protein
MHPGIFQVSPESDGSFNVEMTTAGGQPRTMTEDERMRLTMR